MRSSFISLLFVIGCNEVQTSPMHASSSRAVGLRDADATLHAEHAVDYSRPFSNAPVGRHSTALFDSKCEQGDMRACRIAVQLTPSPERYASVAENCRRGDLASCRTLPGDETTARYPELLGSQSRSIACQKAEPTCDAHALGDECQLGFPAACSQLDFVAPLSKDNSPMRAIELGFEGCAQDILSECAIVVGWAADERAYDSARRLCEETDSCHDLSAMARSKHKLDDARDALERECQFNATSSVPTCVELAEGYINGLFQEPTSARGWKLLRWACPKIDKDRHSAFLARHPRCERAVAEQSTNH